VEKLKGYKTAIVNAVVVVAGLLISFGVISPELGNVITANIEGLMGAILAIIGVVNIGLRVVTDTKIGTSE